MPASSSEDRLQKLTEQKRQIEERIKRLSAKQTTVERKRETRRKILAGAVVLKEAADNPKFGEWLRKLLSEKIITARDRHVLDLSTPTISTEANDNPATSQDQPEPDRLRRPANNP